jgi:hypothetical protein
MGREKGGDLGHEAEAIMLRCWLHRGQIRITISGRGPMRNVRCGFAPSPPLSRNCDGGHPSVRTLFVRTPWKLGADRDHP